MAKRWTKDEEELLRELIDQKYTYEQIGIKLDRSSDAIRVKTLRLGLRSKRVHHRLKNTKQYKKELPKGIEIVEEYINAKTTIMHKHVLCGCTWKATPSSILNGNGCPKCAGNKKKTTTEYKKLLSKDILCKESYINANTKILHKHTLCGHTWKATPDSILRGSNCPSCAKYGFNPNVEAVTYVLYFPLLDLYKIGVSNKLADRIKQFGYKAEIIFYVRFKVGKDALLLEKKWLANIKNYMKNTNLLVTGNTETFKYS